MDKENVVCVCVCVCIHTYIHTMDYYSATGEKDINSFAATRMDLETVILSELSQEENDREPMISLIGAI